MEVPYAAVGIVKKHIGTSSTDTTLNVHTSSIDSTVNIGTVADGATNKSVLTFGGAFSNTANSTFTIKNAQTILDGDLDVNGGDLQSNSATINLFTRAGYGSEVNFASRASVLNFGGVAGSTTIRNSLKVNGDADIYGDTSSSGDPSGGLYGAGKSGYSINDKASANLAFTAVTASVNDVRFDASLSASAAAGNLVKVTVALPSGADVEGVKAFAPSGSAKDHIAAHYPAFTTTDGTNVSFIIDPTEAAISASSTAGNSKLMIHYHDQPNDQSRGDFETTFASEGSNPEEDNS